MALPYRPLGLVKQLLEEIDIEITYAFEDLVFIQNNPALLQFGKVGEMLFFYANEDIEAAEAAHLFATIQAKVGRHGMSLVQQRRYRLSEAAGENLSLEFLEDKAPPYNGGGGKN